MIHRRERRTALWFLVSSLVLSACSGSPTVPARESASTEELKITSAGVELAARLCLPAGQPPFPAAVAVHGSGMVWGKDLRGYCDALNPRGIAVLLYDKRGVGDSGGNYRTVSVENSIAQLNELADDAAAGFDYLRTRPEINPKRVGMIGQSQAGWIIPLAASKRPDVAFMVLISGPSVSVGEEMYYSALTRDAEWNARSLRDSEYERRRKKEFTGPYGYDPEPVIRSVRAPSLWILGGQDESIPAYRCARVLSFARDGGRVPVSIKIHRDGNHSLTDVKTGQQIPYWDDIYRWLAERRIKPGR
jgi:dienelactone hydrolase